MKYTNFYIIGSFIAFLVLGCTKPDTVPNFNFNLSVVSIDGIDLLDPNNLNAYNEDTIQLFYKMADGCIVAGQERYDYILENSDSYLMNISLLGNSNHYHNSNLVFDDADECLYWTSGTLRTLYIKWNAQDTDTIVASCGGKKNGGRSIDKIWYNDSLIDLSKEYNPMRIINIKVIK